MVPTPGTFPAPPPTVATGGWETTREEGHLIVSSHQGSPYSLADMRLVTSAEGLSQRERDAMLSL
jgi:hypothetical protein